MVILSLLGSFFASALVAPTALPVPAVHPVPSVLLAQGGGAGQAVSGGSLGHEDKLSVECLEGELEEPFAHDLTGFVNPPLLFYNAVHMSLIPRGPHRGQILTFDIDPTHFEDEGNERGTWVQRWAIVHPPPMDGSTPPLFFNGELELTPCGGDIFCSGHAWDSEGRLFVAGGTSGWGPYEEEPKLNFTANSTTTGGQFGFYKGRPCHPKYPDEIGARLAYYWDPTLGPEGTWIELPGLEEARYYPTVKLLPDGRMLVMGGGPTPDIQTYYNNYEVFDPATGQWEATGSGHVFPGPVYPDGRDPIQLYPRLHLMTTGELFLSSMTGWAARLDHAAAPGVWEILGHTGYDYRIYGTALTLPEIYEGPDRVMIAGGDAFLGTTKATLQFLGSTNKVQVAHGAAPSAPGWGWQKRDRNHRGRTYPMLLALPDGSLLMTGGQTYPGFQRLVGSFELYTPATRTWREIGDPYPLQKHSGGGEEHLNLRAYHQGALLLPDGRVLIGGGNIRSSDYIVWRPPYLVCGLPRPVITGNPAKATWLEPVTITHEPLEPGHDVWRAVLMAPGSTTHHADYSASHVELKILSSTPTGVQVEMPYSPNHAPPGFYMLFLLSRADVPSVASWIELR